MAVNKVQAVYELREAAEEHGRAEAQVDANRSLENRDRLLDAKERLEEKTVQAIEACQYCGETHCDDESHKNVIRVDFEKKAGDEGDEAG